jgi:hypothetical protein
LKKNSHELRAARQQVIVLVEFIGLLSCYFGGSANRLATCASRLAIEIELQVCELRVIE